MQIVDKAIVWLIDGILSSLVAFVMSVFMPNANMQYMCW